MNQEVKIPTSVLQEVLSVLILGTETSIIKSEKAKSFFFKTVEGNLYIYASSQNIQLSYNYGAIETPLNLVLDARDLKHLVDKTKKPEIIFRKEEDPGITWKVIGNGTYQLQNFAVESPDTFYLEEVSNEVLKIDSTELASAMQKSIFFVNEERQDPHLRNFYFDGNMVATDRKSIQVVRTSLTDKTECKLLIPQIFYDVCQKLKSPLEIHDQGSYYILIAGKYRVQLPMIAGVEKFPDYGALMQIPQEEYEDTLIIDRKEFLSAAERATYFTDKAAYHGIALNIEVDKIRLIVEESNKIEEEVECSASRAETIALNATYLKTALDIFSDDTIRMKYRSPQDVVFFEEESSRLLLVPVLL